MKTLVTDPALVTAWLLAQAGLPFVLPTVAGGRVQALPVPAMPEPPRLPPGPAWR